jgi:hypothetical protein
MRKAAGRASSRNEIKNSVSNAISYSSGKAQEAVGCTNLEVKREIGTGISIWGSLL